MPLDPDTSADELGRTFAAMLKASRAVPDLIDSWRAVTDWRERERQAHQGFRDDDERSIADEVLSLVLKVQAVMLNRQVQLGLEWQRLVARHVPRVRERLDDFRYEDDPLPEVRAALIDEIRLYLNELGELAMDHGHNVKADIERLQRDLLPHDRSDGVERTRLARAVQFRDEVTRPGEGDGHG